MHGCGNDQIVLAIPQFLSSWTWHFTSILSFSKSQHIVFRNRVHYTFCRTYYKCCSHIHIWRSCAFSAVCWAFFMLFPLLRFLVSFEIWQFRNSYNRELAAYSVFSYYCILKTYCLLFSSNFEFFKMEQSENTQKFLAVNSLHTQAVKKKKKSAYLT